MKLYIPSMVWHGEKERILTLAFHPFMNLLVTGGSDGQKGFEEDAKQTTDDIGHIKMWEMRNTSEWLENQPFNFLGALGGHTSTVNCLKFSPNGQYLASGSDDHQIIIWERRSRPRMGTNETRITWCDSKVLPGHGKEVYDLSWSNCGTYLVSASLDNRAILWNVPKAKLMQTMDGHTSYVQGVVFDPKMKFIITTSQDRSVKVWKSNKSKKSLQYYCAHNIRRLELKPNGNQMQDEEQQQTNSIKLFLDENIIFTFVRRPDWSPDGSLFIVPCAQYASKPSEKTQLGALLFVRCQPDRPALFISTNNKPALVVKFCPVLFKRDSEFTIIDIPYKMVFAIATLDQVLIYSTESLVPMAIFGNIHFASITELCFKGSSFLGASSCDGFCSFIMLNGDLGQEYPMANLNEEQRSLFIKDDYYGNQTQQRPTQQIDPQNQIQKVEIMETGDGQVKKKIVPKMIGTL